MASAFLEEALSTDVDESAVNALVGSLENQLVAKPPAPPADPLKIVYPTTAPHRIVYPGPGGQAVSLPNGNIGLSAPPTTNLPAQPPPATTPPKTTASMEVPKPTGTALVIKSAPTPPSSSTVSSVVTFTKPITQGGAGGQPTIVGSQLLPGNVQILNVNTLRPGGAQTPGAKGLPSRVMIGAQPMAGGRPVQPGQITLQTIQGLPTQGHLLLKTENGQYQLLRVGPAAPAVSGSHTAQTITANSANTTFRVQTIPGTTASSAGVQTVPTLNSQGTSTIAAVNVKNNTVTTQRGSVDQTKEKCRKFLANLLELSSREPKPVERNVRTLIQELVDTKVEPEQFCDRLEKLLNASPQPCLIGFLKKSLPLLRQSMVNNELVIDGIRPPPASTVFSTASIVTTSMASHPIQVRPQVQTTNMTTAGPQVRVITQPMGTIRTGQPIHRIISPMRPTGAVAGGVGVVGAGAAVGAKVAVASGLAGQGVATGVGVVRPGTAQIVRTPTGPTITLRATPTLTKAQFTTRPTFSSVTPFPTAKHSIVVKAPVPAQKEKKSFSSSYTGDDDINDVAAMGGVNLAEETQRILGSTEFVGTQIRSCKDDVFLHSTPLMLKISQIAKKYGLDEPNSDVAALISHATQERLKNFVEKLAVIAEHRIDLNKADPRYEVTQDVRAQLKCLEEVDKAERKRHEEQERELLLRAAKSRSKPDDPEQAKLKAKAKEMQRAEMDELRQKEANLTALLAIGPRKKQKLDESHSSPSSLSGTFNSSNSSIMMRPRVKRVCLRDLLMLLEQEKETCRSHLLYRSYLK